MCESTGTPAPTISWHKEGMILEEPDYVQFNDGSLYITNTKLKDQGHFIVRATNNIGVVEETVRVTVVSPSPPESDPNHPPLNVSDFIEMMALLQSNNSDRLEEEYPDIELEWNFTSYAAKLPINHGKNRYVNIIPYDHSRVTLKPDGNPGSDYINASFIGGLNSPKDYIATQGPIPAAFPDFWRMIWEYNVPTIIMVTNLKEDDKIKCHQYWPSFGAANYGSFQVTLKEVETVADYAIRTFQLQSLHGQGPIKEVRQYHFLVWPDHGVPQYATPLLSFQKRVRNHHKGKPGPMVVHCSAGVGRTGTFITIDTMIMKIDAEGIVDIFNFVRGMRFCRNYMVQTASQYDFLHHAILEAIMCRDTTIPAVHMATKIATLKEIAPSSGKTGFQSQFETLESSSPTDDDFDCSIAQLSDNLAKSRVKEHLPPNDYRVVLSTKNYDSDYICASYVDGYRQRSAFIATQGPMKNTAGDFWRMVWEMKSMIIIMLTNTEENGEEQSVQYWPVNPNEEDMYGSFNVVALPEERALPDYIVRKFKLSHSKNPDDSRTITHFQYINWPSTSCPKEATSMIDLVADVVRIQRKSGNGPITVHCSDGLGRTGTFCAMFTVLERLKAEQVIDVFSTVKTLRIQRPGFVNDIDQYEFIHKAALEFVNTFDNYDNFKY
ncbi:PREDICTED: receptor-type tyrosine-protein phosphatase S-like [Amphimedon queenslandica]|uniref:protein-tyrosine-phosphatase n=3 Tax=Amphimedon queenslandica TaxID=400682 RepID=A0A1X7U9D0_AMPQE|nr:PREDICTED: receptor-type tyrosine-protein phosphatase S-like [Amphimedon queenslandica]|eukprot:XP_019855567.1 PREDICTED: receptor-type tyrosine-protein phosphatase S-like [Amphimedon queenslandica]